MRKLLAVLTGAAAILLVAPACDPAPPRRVVYADSLGWQVQDSDAGSGREWHALVGASLADWGLQAINDLDHATPTVILALGTNDAGTWEGRDGWTAKDESDWTTVGSFKKPQTCLIVTLPHLGPEAGAVNLAEVEEARAWLTNWAPTVSGGGAVLADWRPAASQPGILGPDGIHLTGTPESIAARLGLLDAAEAACP